MFQERLNELADRVEGALSVSLVGRDGLVVQSVQKGESPSQELMAAEIPERIRVLERQVPELSAESLRQLTVTSDRYTIMLSSMSDEYFMLLVLEAGASPGTAGYELRKAALQMRDDLD